MLMPIPYKSPVSIIRNHQMRFELMKQQLHGLMSLVIQQRKGILPMTDPGNFFERLSFVDYLFVSSTSPKTFVVFEGPRFFGFRVFHLRTLKVLCTPIEKVTFERKCEFFRTFLVCSRCGFMKFN